MLTASPVTKRSRSSVGAAKVGQHLAGLDADAQARSGRVADDAGDRLADCISSAARTARSGSSSWVAGTPKTASIASPANFSTVPPIALDLARPGARRPRTPGRLTTSASRRSLSSVKPTMSAKSSVAILRSRGCGRGQCGRSRSIDRRPGRSAADQQCLGRSGRRRRAPRRRRRRLETTAHRRPGRSARRRRAERPQLRQSIAACYGKSKRALSIGRRRSRAAIGHTLGAWSPAPRIEHEYRVRFDEADADGWLRPSGLLRYAQDMAWRHSDGGRLRPRLVPDDAA